MWRQFRPACSGVDKRWHDRLQIDSCVFIELDWAGVCWDADFRYWNGIWNCLRFHGTRWQNVNTAEGRLYLKNAYGVILTRARQGMIIYVPKGAEKDPTRPPSYS